MVQAPFFIPADQSAHVQPNTLSACLARFSWRHGASALSLVAINGVQWCSRNSSGGNNSLCVRTKWFKFLKRYSVPSGARNAHSFARKCWGVDCRIGQCLAPSRIAVKSCCLALLVRSAFVHCCEQVLRFALLGAKNFLPQIVQISEFLGITLLLPHARLQ